MRDSVVQYFEKCIGGLESDYLDFLSSIERGSHYPSDGTEVVDLTDAERIELAEEYIREAGIESFTHLLKSEPLSQAIWATACAATQSRIQNEAIRVAQQINAKCAAIQAPPGWKIQKIKILFRDSLLDHYPLKGVRDGDIEEYRNLDGTGNADLYHMCVKFPEGGGLYCNLEAWLKRA